MAITTSEIELVHAAQSGDVAALGTLLEQHRAQLYAAALAILGDYQAAQDAVHDAFLITLRRLSDLRNPQAISAWLHAIVRNTCRMQLRARREWPDNGETQSDIDDLGFDRMLDQMALRDWVWAAIDSLPETLSAAVMLRYFSRNTSYAEIASMLDIPVGTVRSRLNEARRRLALELTATATTAHSDHGVLLHDRLNWIRAAMDEMVHAERATIYAEGCAPDTIVTAGWRRSQLHGIANRKRDTVETFRNGVQVTLTGIVASTSVTILEIDFENPPTATELCPPKHTEVRFHPAGQTTRINLYYQSAQTELTAVF